MEGGLEFSCQMIMPAVNEPLARGGVTDNAYRLYQAEAIPLTYTSDQW